MSAAQNHPPLPARLRRRWNRLVHEIYIDAQPDYRAARLLAGSGRSGTTWIAEVLASDNFYRFMVEPFNCGRVPQCKPFALRQYLRPEDDDPRFLAPARAIFSGRIRNDLIDCLTRPRVYKRRLIKDVRSNLMLTWMRRHFPDLPIVFMMRHPCAVAHSRVKLGWTTKLPEMFFAQPALMQDFLAPFREHIASARTGFEIHLFDWCVENYVPLMQLNKGDAYMLFYEHLCMDPRGEIERLCSYLGRPFDDAMLKAIDRPSSSPRTMAGRERPTAEELVCGWQAHVTSDEIRRAVDISGLFGLDRVYSQGPMPLVESALGILNDPAATSQPLFQRP
ncbi:MAG: sulfotransferase [Candidatus Eremiobacteraeota bacterium]|nr:sulfotransferase [Candidatus Eremiobacteraeota bacterium]MBC5827121.1 sulfotransferase [Candidatus Eremiobacteraeota bacterium]